MKFPRISVTFLSVYLLAGAVLSTGALFLYMHRLVAELRKDAEVVTEIYARFCSVAADPDATSAADDLVFDTVIRRIDFPVVITDRDGVPQHWVNVGVPSGADDEESLQQLYALVESMDRESSPIDVRLGESGPLLSRVHFSDSERIRELRIVPRLMVFILVLFGGIGVWIYHVLRTQQERALWVGLARETAHQLGTPLSGLSGWIDLLDDGTLPPDKVAPEMRTDLDRLEAVAARFGRIGARPQLAMVDIPDLLEEVVDRFRRVSPRSGAKVEFNEQYLECPSVRGDAELFAWVVENVVRNALEACRAVDRPAIVCVRCLPGPLGRHVIVEVEDNGRGMNRTECRRAFRPGHTTKDTGWGLGLPLARRIMEGDHSGRLFIARSRPGEGTVMEIRFPTG